jgi:hypothetical protein
MSDEAQRKRLHVSPGLEEADHRVDAHAKDKAVDRPDEVACQLIAGRVKSELCKDEATEQRQPCWRDRSAVTQFPVNPELPLDDRRKMSGATGLLPAALSFQSKCGGALSTRLYQTGSNFDLRSRFAIRTRSSP